MTYAYDAIGQRRRLLDPDNGKFTTVYDVAGRLVRVINPQGDRTTFAYDDADRRIVKRMANGARTSLNYDNADRLTRVVHLKSSNVTISSFTYRYDDTNRRTRVVESSGDVVTWTYDAAYQLIRERRSGVSSYDVTHTWDPAGNRLVKRDSGARTTAVYDAANRLVYTQDGTGRTSFTYDANGNLIKQKTPAGAITTSLWDIENLNTAVKIGAVRVTYTYNGDKLRVQKASTAGDNRKLIYDGRNVLCEQDTSNASQALYTLEPKEYGNLISQRLLVSAVWTPVYCHFDALGSTDRLTDSAQVITDTYTYFAFGELKTSTGTTSNRYTWVGELGYVSDTETGEKKLDVRQYTPQQARFKSADPLGIDADPNLYRYVGNDSANKIDPTGLLEGDLEILQRKLKSLEAQIQHASPSKRPSLMVKRQNTLLRIQQLHQRSQAAELEPADTPEEAPQFPAGELLAEPPHVMYSGAVREVLGRIEGNRPDAIVAIDRDGKHLPYAFIQRIVERANSKQHPLTATSWDLLFDKFGANSYNDLFPPKVVRQPSAAELERKAQRERRIAESNAARWAAIQRAAAAENPVPEAPVLEQRDEFVEITVDPGWVSKLFGAEGDRIRVYYSGKDPIERDLAFFMLRNKKIQGELVELHKSIEGGRVIAEASIRVALGPADDILGAVELAVDPTPQNAAGVVLTIVIGAKLAKGGDAAKQVENAADIAPKWGSATKLAENVASRNWPAASIEKAIARHAGENYTTWVTKTGKRIYENPANGRQIVHDLEGGYFRIFQPDSIGSQKGSYLNLLGDELRPARFGGRGVHTPPLRDVDKGMWLQETHFFIQELLDQ